MENDILEMIEGLYEEDDAMLTELETDVDMEEEDV